MGRPKLHLTICWTVFDILSRDRSLTVTDAICILKILKDNHDSSIGINWDVIDQTIQEYKDGQ